MLAPDDLVLCPGTLREASFEEVAEAAAAAGCAGMSARPYAVAAAIERMGSVAATRRYLEDIQVKLADFDALCDWQCDAVVVPDFVPRTGVFEQAALLDLAAAMGARSVNIVELAQSVPVEALVEPFARTCERAAALGLLVHVEFFASSAVSDLASAAWLVRQAGQANGGVLLDSFHWHRGPQDAANRLEDHADLITMLQLGDASAQASGDGFEEMMRARLLPGEGVVGLAGLMARLRAAGVTAPIGIEVFSDRLHAMEPVAAARLAAEATCKALGVTA